MTKNIMQDLQDALAKAEKAFATDTEILRVSTEKRDKSIAHLQELIAAKNEDQARINARFEKQLKAKQEKIDKIKAEIEAVKAGVAQEAAKTEEELLEEQLKNEEIAEAMTIKKMIDLQ